MAAYYNEFDKDAVFVLRHLISKNLIAPGDVDDRSIKDVQPDDLKGYTQCHFFAGAGIWSVAARMAGWPDDRALWTGSCPCQPFSAAGKGGGVDDIRHLWPDFFRLIRARRPPVVMGEQVAGAPGYGWLDGVRSDLEREDYASRAVDIPACSVDAPHIRNRLYWCAMDNPECDGQRKSFGPLRPGRDAVNLSDATCIVADAHKSLGWLEDEQSSGQQSQLEQNAGTGLWSRSRNDALGDTEGSGGSGTGRSETHHGREGSGEYRGPDASDGHGALADAIGGERDGRSVIAVRSEEGRTAVSGDDAGSRSLADTDGAGRIERAGAGVFGGGFGELANQVGADVAVAEGFGGTGSGEGRESLRSRKRASGRHDSDGGLVDAESLGWGEGRPEPELRGGRTAAPGAGLPDSSVGDALGAGLEGQRRDGHGGGGWAYASRSTSPADGGNGSFWAGAEWIACHDGKARRTESGLCLLVDGMAGRIPAWRLGGNAIVAPLAAEVIRAFLDVEAEQERLRLNPSVDVFA